MQYPLVLTLKDGKNETLFSVRDFEYLMEKYMGYEAVKYFRSMEKFADEIAEERGQTINELKTEILSLKQKIVELESDFHDEH